MFIEWMKELMDKYLSRCLYNKWIIFFVFPIALKVPLGSTSYSSGDETLSLWAVLCILAAVMVWCGLHRPALPNVTFSVILK